ncbi:MMPL family transporter [Lederbergia panacisoli]|uniref:MMPL family transporter n=1 Tax=Lederbergia panacisoli TaxID=1255251 RepID=UPI00214C8DFF|nr:MMPL family transporter [Lederbergia panacisoli]MCR2822206.1 MMPL family transporter [Lederbergia panacisoli]
MKFHPFNTWGKFVGGSLSRWITLAIWVLLTLVLSFSWPAVNTVEDDSVEDLPAASMSRQADILIKKEFPNDAGNPVLIVWHRDDKLTDQDYEAIQKLYSSLNDEPLNMQTTLPPLGNVPVPALAQSSSKDGTSIVTPIFFDKNAGTEILQENMKSLVERVNQTLNEDPFEKKLSEPGLHVRLSGPVGIQTDAANLFSQADVKLLIATVLLVLILLILLYRSPFMAIIPLIVVGFAYGLISPILGFLADHGWITADAQGVSIMTVLLFGAGTDYCLFLISRYRDTLLHEENKFKALQTAIKESGGAVTMSALTVVIGLATLGLAHYGSFHRFAVPFSLAVLLMGIAALTLLPALLAIFGRAAFYPFIPRTIKMTEALSKKKGSTIKQRKEKGKFSKGLGRMVTHRPWTIIIFALILLVGLASFVPRIHYTYNLLESFPKDMPSREGFDLIANHFSAGELAPVKIVIDTEGKHEEWMERLEQIAFIESVMNPLQGKNNLQLQLYEVSLKENPYSVEAINRIPELRDYLKEIMDKSGIKDAESHFWIGGETAALYDTKVTTDRDQSVIIPVMISIISLLLLLYLRSLTAMIYLVATVVLSFFSALGAGWLVLHYGLGDSAIQGAIPLYAFVFLVALGEDYNIFMVSEIWKNKRIQNHQEAISNGVIQTGSVITSAGLILAGTFAVLATLPIQVLVQFGIVTAIGVLLDTFIVRPLLVPAITTVLGRYAFWPGKLWRKKDVSAEKSSI